MGIEVGVKPDGMSGSFSFTAEVYGRPCSRKREHSAYRESCCSQGLGSFQILPVLQLQFMAVCFGLLPLSSKFKVVYENLQPHRLVHPSSLRVANDLLRQYHNSSENLGHIITCI